MRRELFETGKSVDSAIDAACEKLGCLRDDCEWEIIDLPKKGFLGLKNTPAKVRVSIGAPDEEPLPQKPAVKPAERSAERRQSQPPKQAERSREEQANQEPAKKVDENEISEKEKIAKEYLAQMLEAAGLKAEYAVTREHGGSCINIIGDGLGMVIGRRGETLDAIQYLTGLVANRNGGDYLRLTVDCGDYRLKRKDTLEALAKKLAAQVIKTNVSRTLEPMNPFERRIIHARVSEIEGVSSSSVGEEPNRRVVITSPTARPAAVGGGFRRDGERGGYNRSRGYNSRPPREAGEKTAYSREDGERPAYNRDGRGGRDDGRRDDRHGGRGPRPSTPAPQGPPKQTPEAEATTGVLFGKIDLE